MDGSFAKSRRLLILIIAFFMLGALSLGFSVEKKDIAHAENRSSRIVMRADTFEILKGENYNVRMPMASTTKIMTALLICENCRPEETIVIPKEAVGIEGSSVYLKEGEKYTVKELLYGLMLRSGNDCAVALALHLAGNIKNFADMMNMRAKSLGLIDTHYVNPHGLHDKEHYTSCYDLCKLGCIAIKNPLFKEIVCAKLTTIGEGESRKTIAKKNKILFRYEGGNGIKTGYTRAAGRCLVASAERNGLQLVSAVLNVPDMFGECERLMDYGFSLFENKA